MPFAFVNELIEGWRGGISLVHVQGVDRPTERLTLGVPHHGGILLLVVGQITDETVHVKGIELPIGLLLPAWSVEVLAVGVQKTSQAADKCCPHAVRVESVGTNQRYETEAPVMRQAATSAALVETVSF